MLMVVVLMSCNTAKKRSASSPAAFEGKIIYDFKFEDKTGHMSAPMIKAFVGDEQTYVIKGNKYKTVMNGQSKVTQYYLGGDTLYSHFLTVNNLLWNDATVNPDEVISYEIKKGAATIAGIKCDLLTIKSEEGTTLYYFNRKYRANPEDYAKHAYGFWKFCIEKTQALPIKQVTDSEELHVEIMAKEIKPMPVDNGEFKLPNLTLMKNPDH